jgi:hypothetical protein
MPSAPIWSVFTSSSIVKNDTAALRSSTRCAGSSKSRGSPSLSPW